MEKGISVYTNSARVSSTIYDLQIRFYYKSIAENLEKDDQGIEALGDMLFETSMSLPHAKTLVRLIQENIDAYEKTFGQILVENNMREDDTAKKEV